MFYPDLIRVPEPKLYEIYDKKINYSLAGSYFNKVWTLNLEVRVEHSPN